MKTTKIGNEWGNVRKMISVAWREISVRDKKKKASKKEANQAWFRNRDSSSAQMWALWLFLECQPAWTQEFELNHEAVWELKLELYCVLQQSQISVETAHEKPKSKPSEQDAGKKNHDKADAASKKKEEKQEQEGTEKENKKAEKDRTVQLNPRLASYILYKVSINNSYTKRSNILVGFGSCWFRQVRFYGLWSSSKFYIFDLLYFHSCLSLILRRLLQPLFDAGYWPLAAFCLIFTYFAVERKLRFGKDAQSLIPSVLDQNTTKLMWLSIYGTITLLLLGIALTFFGVASFASHALNCLGLLLMVCGLSLRVAAALSLREFYTRTLRVMTHQTLIRHGIYKFIRHPGFEFRSFDVLLFLCVRCLRTTILTCDDFYWFCFILPW